MKGEQRSFVEQLARFSGSGCTFKFKERFFGLCQGFVLGCSLRGDTQNTWKDTQGPSTPSLFNDLWGSLLMWLLQASDKQQVGKTVFHEKVWHVEARRFVHAIRANGFHHHSTHFLSGCFQTLVQKQHAHRVTNAGWTRGGLMFIDVIFDAGYTSHGHRYALSGYAHASLACANLQPRSFLVGILMRSAIWRPIIEGSFHIL